LKESASSSSFSSFASFGLPALVDWFSRIMAAGVISVFVSGSASRVLSSSSFMLVNEESLEGIISSGFLSNKTCFLAGIGSC
jgi:multisubunit Na+/H+ antiporter MnhG subunit